MVLSRVQAEETLELFENNVVLETTGMKRKRLFQRFGDIFGNGIIITTPRKCIDNWIRLYTISKSL